MFCLYAWFVLVALAIGCNDRSVLHFGSCTIEASAMVQQDNLLIFATGEVSATAAECLGIGSLQGVPVLHCCGDAGACTVGWVPYFTQLHLHLEHVPFSKTKCTLYAV